jgi:hypothetical protein
MTARHHPPRNLDELSDFIRFIFAPRKGEMFFDETFPPYTLAPAPRIVPVVSIVPMPVFYMIAEQVPRNCAPCPASLSTSKAESCRKCS